MTTLNVSLDKDLRWYRPGETISGTISWFGEKEIETAEVNLCWYTQGKGTEDAAIVRFFSVPSPQRSDSRSFEFTVPNGPYSFSGTLISLRWTLELIVQPSGESQRIDILVSPNAGEITLEPVSDE